MVSSALFRNAVISIGVIVCVLNLLILTTRTKSSDFLSKPAVLGRGIFDNYDVDVNHEASEEDVNELDGCYHVFLDVGSNTGNQVTRSFLFLPQK